MCAYMCTYVLNVCVCVCVCVWPRSLPGYSQLFNVMLKNEEWPVDKDKAVCMCIDMCIYICKYLYEYVRLCVHNVII